MKVLNLCCSSEHRFEGWFASEADFQSQIERDLVACPMCESRVISRLPSAPRLNMSKSAPPTVQAGPPAVDPRAQGQGQWLQAMRQVLKNTEDVGDRFPEEARRIHYGEAKERGIRGRASKDDAEALREEGIDVMAVAMPESLKGPIQ